MTQVRSVGALIGSQRVIPLIQTTNPESALQACRALADGGLRVIEIVLRTSVALDAVRLVRQALPHVVVAVGTVKTPSQMAEAVTAGAHLIVSPGTTVAMYDAARDLDVPFLPGTSTPSDVLLSESRGFEIVKVFPIAQLGGAAYLVALASVFPAMRFVPTGGITSDDVATYLAVAGVAAVGGSFPCPRSSVDSGDWTGIRRRADALAGLHGEAT